MNKLSRYAYIDYLRAICSVMVIAIHVIMHYINAFETKDLPWTILVLSKAFTQCAVPIFFMISGATILSSTKEESYSSFIKRRLSRVVIPLFVYSILYYLFFVFIKNEYALSFSIFSRKFVRNGISGHFWYIYALVPLYFLFPVLRNMVKSITKKQLLIFISVLFVLNSFMPFLNEVLSIFSKYKFGYYSFGEPGVYFTYTLLGYYIHNYVTPKENNLKTKLLLYLSVILSVGAMTAMTWYFSVKKIDQTWIDITWPFVVILSAAVMILAKLSFEEKPIGEFKAKALSFFGLLSFSAYLVHMLVLRTTQIYLPRTALKEFTELQSLGIMLVIFIIGVIASYLWAFIVSKIPVIRKLL